MKLYTVDSFKFVGNNFGRWLVFFLLICGNANSWIRLF